MNNLLARFFSYIEFDTQADESQSGCPSTAGQLSLARHLATELSSLGLQQIELDANGYLTALLPSNVTTDVPAIGFIAHMDTAPDFSGHKVQAQLVEAYQGGDIALGNGQEVLSPGDFPSLRSYLGQDLITTDGTTLLGADDKAGICEIITAMAHLLAHPEIPHGDIYLGFTPDEEIGRGADLFPLDRFKARWAYTVDGGELGELEFENFNAAAAKIIIKGLNVHPGYAKGKMVNASLLAMDFASWLPVVQRPEHTTDYEGFFHLTNMTGTVEEATLSYIVRDHVRSLFEQKKQLLQLLVDRMNEMHPGSTRLEVRDQYYNMREVVEPQKHIVDLAFEAMTAVGVKPLVKPIRGGTDGARLSFMGLPCPNIFAGGLNFHGRYEFLPVQSLEKSMQTIIKITELTAQKS